MSLKTISTNFTSTKRILPVAVFGMMLGLAGCSEPAATEDTAAEESVETETAESSEAEATTDAGAETVTI